MKKLRFFNAALSGPNLCWVRPSRWREDFVKHPISVSIKPAAARSSAFDQAVVLPSTTPVGSSLSQR